MAFWVNGQDQDPKRQSRFTAEFAGLGGDCTWMVKNVDKPSVSLSEASHVYLNHTFYYPGRVTWNTIGVTLVDPVAPDATATMMAAINAAGYAPPKTAADLNTASKSKSLAALGEVKIKQINAEGAAVETWILRNAWIKSVTLSGLDYSGDSLSEVSLEIRYDFATLKEHGESVNGTVSKDQGLWDVSG